MNKEKTKRLINYKVVIKTMECKHMNTRKLFWMDTNPNKWEKTDVAICLDCNSVVRRTGIKVVDENGNK